MTDVVGPSGVTPKPSIHTSDDARRRLSRRYRAETRFKLYGLAAIVVSVIFLVILMSTIVGKGLPAFVHSYVHLPIDLTVEKVDPAEPGAADYNAVIRDALREVMPFASSRTDRRVLNGIVSSGANILLRNEVVADPGMLGEKKTIPVPLDDFADLYVKGLITSKTVEAGEGIASPTGTTGTIRVLSTAEDFSKILAEVKTELVGLSRARGDEIAAKNRAVARLDASIPALQARIGEEEGATRARLEAELESQIGSLAAVRAQIASLAAEMASLDQRAAAAGQVENLTTTLPSYFVHINGGIVKVNTVTGSTIEGDVYVPLESTEDAAAGSWQIERIETPEASRKFTDREIAYVDHLDALGLVSTNPNTIFFSRGASREAEMAGIWGAVVGSFYTMVVTLLLSFPIGVAAAIYLEEFAPKTRWTHLIEVNINNLAAVPSIVFGLLGLAVFLNVFNLPRSAPVVGGMVLALMTLPTIIIAARAALKAVPPSIREAALGIGASRIQMVLHHVLPLAMPGIFTGTIIGMAQALGETAPLLMIGMVAFIVDIPGGPLESATVLPVQIYMWADFPEPAFQQKTSAAIMVLLGFLILMNAIAIVLRKRFERRW